MSTQYNIKAYPCTVTDDGTTYFEESDALAVLLANDIVFTYPEKDLFSIAVICNDIFAWGTSDCESIYYSELELLWSYYVKDPIWGAAIWCIVKRKLMPQKPIYDAIQKVGIWNLDLIHGLEKNNC